MKVVKKTAKKSSGAMAMEYEVHVDGRGGGFEAFGTKKEAQDHVRKLVKNGRSLKEITVYSYRTLSTGRFCR